MAGRMNATPRKRDAVRTRARILKQATRIFAAKGFDGARVDAIAKAAGVSPTLIYHYFSGKEALFVAVMEEAYLTIASHHRGLDLDDLPPRRAIAAMAGSLFDLYRRRPEFVSLFNSENLHKARHIARSATIRGLYGPLLDRLEAVVERGVAEGLFRRRICGTDFFVSLIALSYFYIAHQHTLAVVLDEDLMAEDRLAGRRRHLVEMLLAYLDSAPEDSPQAD